MSTQPLNYVDYDYDNLLTQLQQRLALQGAWKDMYRSSTGSMLMELFAAVGTIVLYYVERRAEESYIATAQNYSSIVNLARLLNYIPARNVSSTGTLRFSLAAPHTKMVFIPKYTKAATAEGYEFLVSADGVIMPGQTYVDVGGVQGEKKVVSQTSSGSTSQEYNINDVEIENTNIIVTVNSVVWTEVTSFINSINTSTNYVIRPELDGTVTIVFGNNVFGASPALGQNIDITYIRSDGLIGNVYATGLITTISSTIYDEDGATQTVSVTNTTNFLGGDNAETKEEIRVNAPQVFATGDRAVTKSDYIAILNAYPGVADSNAWGEAEEPSPDYDHYNQVKLVVLLQDWALPDTAFKDVLSTYLYTKSLMTVRYTYVDPTILDVIPTIILKVVVGNQLSYVQSLVETAIGTLFVLGSTTKLGVSKRLGDIYEVVENVPGVSYSHIVYKIRKELLAAYDSTYDFSETADVLPVLASGVELYIDSTLIAADDGAGNWVDSGSTYTVTGALNYVTGLIGANISPAPTGGSTVYIRYQQDQLGDIVVDKEQICRWIENDYISIGYAT